MPKLMVVEDSAAMRGFIATILGQVEGASVVEAASGFDALKRLPRENVDLLVIDINMPDINGLELISFVRANPNYRRIPVIIITTENSAEDRKRGLGLGASDYLVKPFGAADLRRAVEAALGLRPKGWGA